MGVHLLIQILYQCHAVKFQRELFPVRANRFFLQLRFAIDDYLRTAPELASLVVRVRELSARLRELDPPAPVDRDNGVRWTGD